MEKKAVCSKFSLVEVLYNFNGLFVNFVREDHLLKEISKTYAEQH